MDISPAALPPKQPAMPSEAERFHPLYQAYMQHRDFCIRKMITATSWEGFVYQHNRDRCNDEIAKHPRFAEFQQWMRANRGGARPCPAGNAFPQNFEYWLTGGRW